MEHDFDLIGISEHWLQNHEYEYFNALNDKCLVNIFCRTVFKNGGVALYMRDSIPCRVVDLDMYCEEKSLEVTGIEFITNKIIVLTIYRSPNGDFNTFIYLLDRCLAYLNNRNMKLIIGGDFNVHLNVDTVEKAQFVNLLRSHGLYLSSFEPTRGGICLDSIATNLSSEEHATHVTEPVIADHSAVLFEFTTSRVGLPFKLPWHAKYSFNYRVINEKSILRFKRTLCDVNWDLTIGTQNPDRFDLFFDLFCQKFDECIPVKTKRPATTDKLSGLSKSAVVANDWYTPILGTIRKLVLALNDREKSTTNVDARDIWHSRYLMAKRIYRRSVDIAKKDSNTRFIQNANNPCKAAWNVINSHRKKQVSMACVSSPDEINSYFVNIVNDIADGLLDGPRTALVTQSNYCGPRLARWKTVSPDQLVKLVGGFKFSTSSDFYGLTVGVLKEVIGIIAQPLSIVINECLALGLFPDSLKVARVVPVYKKGDRAEVGSYRPIAIIPAIAKVFETVMKIQLTNYFESNKLFCDTQHGFRKSHSTTTALLDAAEKILDAYECGESMALTLCDLSRAFDVVSHELLLQKMSGYGMGGVVLKMLASYLGGRTQVVAVNGATSERIAVNHGVPQGSVLGPLLFLIMVNDFAEGRAALLFADDTTLLSRGSNLEAAVRLAEEDFEDARSWFVENKLLLNEEKTQKIVCTLSNSPDVGHNVVKLLGFKIDSKLTWEAHIGDLCNKLSRVIFLIRKLKSYVTEDYLLTAYHGLFHSHLAYGTVLWGHAPGCIQVLKLQKRVIRIMTSSEVREHCKPIFRRLGILTVYCQYILVSLTYVHEHLNMFQARQDIHSHNTRNKSQLNIPRCRLSKRMDRFPNLALKMYNTLPATVKQMSATRFHLVLKNWLQECAFYSVEEFMENPTQGLGGVVEIN